MSTCYGCKKNLKTQEKISCSQPACGKHYHYLCVNLSVDNFKKQKHWNCPDCAIKLLSVQRREGNKDSTPVKSIPNLEEFSTNDEQQNITIRRPNLCATDYTPPAAPEEMSLRSDIISCIRNEMRSVFRDMFEEEFGKIRKDIQNLQESLAYINEQFDKAFSDIKLCMEESKELKSENIFLKEKTKDLEARLSQVEQDARQSNLAIHCLPEHRQENLVKTVTQLCNVVSFPISENDILSCNRVQKLNSNSKLPRTVICKFSSKLKRDNLLAAVLTYNKAHPKQKLNTKLLGYGDTESPVYVCEHLTQSNKILHAATRIRAKEKQYKFVWIRNGKIFVRKDESSPALIITHKDSLQKL